MTATLPPEVVAGLVQLAGLALVGFLLKRAINSLDESLRDIKATLHVLDQTDRQQGQAIQEHGIRLRLIESTVARMDDRHEEFARFLARDMGFRRSDGGKGPGQ